MIKRLLWMAGKETHTEEKSGVELIARYNYCLYFFYLMISNQKLSRFQTGYSGAPVKGDCTTYYK